jgi:hypothetical protein
VVGHLSGSTLTTTAVPGTTGTDFVRFSPDGSHLAFASNGGATVTVTTLNGTVSTTAAVTAIGHIVWLDNATLLFTMTKTGATAADIYKLDVSAPGTTPVQLTATPANESSLGSPRASNPAPMQPSRLTAVLNGTAATLTWTPPIDGDVTDIVVRRAVGLMPPRTIADGTDVTGDNGSSVTDTVVLGEFYSYSVFAIDSAGQTSGPATITIRAVRKPNLTLPAYAWTSLTAAPVPFSWGAGDPAGTHYLVSYGIGLTPPTWHVMLGDTTAKSALFRPTTTGLTYSIRVRALDGYGHATPATQGSVIIPQDDTTAAFVGSWPRLASSSLWGHSERATKVRGAYVAKAFIGSKVQVLGDRCAACGSFAVYVDNRYRGTFTAVSTTTKHRQVLYTFSASGVHTHTIKLVNLATSIRPQLRVDAFAVTR